MLKMSQINSIRDLSNCGYRISEISKKVGLDRKTVRKYLEKVDFSPEIPLHKEEVSLLDAYKPTILKWIAEDAHNWHKQRHTAKRIFDRLREEMGFEGSYSTVQRYVKAIRSNKKKTVGTLELLWSPGSAQCDFGEADFIIDGIAQRMKYLTVSFPYSDDGFTQVFGGETAECVCQGLKNIFEYIGGVPQLMVFDNATGIGRRIGNVVQEAELFKRFRAHYGFMARFCNPYAGHEKGNVERKVAYVRSNLFVPIPHVSNMEEYNRSLLDKHKIKAGELHYKKGILIADLFKQDVAAMQRLPEKPFTVCRYEWKKADGYGKISIDGKHFYSTCPENSHKDVLVSIWATHIDILRQDGSILVSHKREFGKDRTDSVDYSTTLATLMKNPGAWMESGIRQQAPHPLTEYLDQKDKRERKKQLHVLYELAERYSLSTAFEAMTRSIRNDKLNASDARVLAERIFKFGLHTKPSAGPDLTLYDDLLLKGGDQR